MSKSPPQGSLGEEARLDPRRLGRELQRGDPRATREVRERVQRILAFRGYRFSVEDRRDIEQEVMTQLWQAAQRKDGDFGAGLWGFVEVVTARRCIDWMRARRVHSPLQDVHVAEGDPFDEAMARERESIMETALGRLDEGCRRLIALRLRERRSYTEISGLEGSSEGALRIRMHRCIKKVGDIVKELQAVEVSRDRKKGT